MPWSTNCAMCFADSTWYEWFYHSMAHWWNICVHGNPHHTVGDCATPHQLHKAQAAEAYHQVGGLSLILLIGILFLLCLP